jgi:hypothetical protein
MDTSITSSERLALVLRRGPANVKSLASDAGISESRTRELLKTIEGVETDGEKPAKFWIADDAGETLTVTPAVQADLAEELAPAEDRACPFCDATHSDTTAAGPEGTFLGDSVSLCHKCGKSHNIYTKEEVALDFATKKERKILNPQPQIDKKTALVEAAGGTLTYAGRKWTITIGGKAHTITSREFSTYTGEELIGLVS